MIGIVTALYIFGIIGVLVSLVIGLLSGSFWIFLLTFVGGVIFATIQFALANVLEKQEMILYYLQQQDQFLKKQLGTTLRKCSNCQYEFDAELSSCPRCGSRKEAGT
ncbi:hypothetical protein J8TS2_12500 [Lederbergia ruris]|uniref:Zinc ribbon domain-containing protein n=1 Tax=Lederbergia ruris TaxID=217495 RepID=A0ABQ4KG31_9BACI|nr:hypothetical protein [Lederbergia ruris]GIN56931.1 hypothetical protein J8TS2_12500 [Lederbergia ruris]